MKNGIYETTLISTYYVSVFDSETKYSLASDIFSSISIKQIGVWWNPNIKFTSMDKQMFDVMKIMYMKHTNCDTCGKAYPRYANNLSIVENWLYGGDCTICSAIKHSNYLKKNQCCTII